MQTMQVAVIDTGSGNLRSAAKALERAALDAGLDVKVQVTSDPKEVAAADRIVLPGVGAFAACRAGLAAVPGLEAALSQAVIDQGRPFLGICVGMQLLAGFGHEFGITAGLGWIPGDVRRMAPQDLSLKIPHMGWNGLVFPEKRHALFSGIEAGAQVYFVHSYHFEAKNTGQVAAWTDYGGPLVAALARDNLFGTQFHPEKSQGVGLRLLGNFLRWRP